MKIQFVLACFAMCGLSACASITRTNVVDFVVETDPSGATVRTSTGFLCQSPCIIKHPRKGGFTLTVSKPGFETVNVAIESRLAGSGAAGVAGNVLIGGVFGIAADVASGASNDLAPNPVKLTLQPQKDDK